MICECIDGVRTLQRMCVVTNDLDFACTYPGPRQMAVDRNSSQSGPHSAYKWLLFTGRLLV